MKNPLEQMRETMGMDRRPFANWLGCSYTLVAHTEQGYYLHLPPKIKRGLMRGGIDVNRMEAAYTLWRERQQERDAEAAQRALDRVAAAL